MVRSEKQGDGLHMKNKQATLISNTYVEKSLSMQLCVYMCKHKGTAEAGCACLHAPLRKDIYGNRHSRHGLGELRPKVEDTCNSLML